VPEMNKKVLKSIRGPFSSLFDATSCDRFIFLIMLPGVQKYEKSQFQYSIPSLLLVLEQENTIDILTIDFDLNFKVMILISDLKCL
jgi:hypothetical protein